MNEIERIVLIITAICLIFQYLKIREKKLGILWNLAPFGIGFCTCLWIARIFGG